MMRSTETYRGSLGGAKGGERAPRIGFGSTRRDVPSLVRFSLRSGDDDNEDSNGGDSNYRKGNNNNNNSKKKKKNKKLRKKHDSPLRVFVGNFPYETTESELADFFSDHGYSQEKISSLKIQKDWRTKLSKGYGFVTFTDEVYAVGAADCLDGVKFGDSGRRLRLGGAVYKEKPVEAATKKNKKKEKDKKDEGDVDTAADLEVDELISSAIALDGGDESPAGGTRKKRKERFGGFQQFISDEAKDS